MNDVELLIEKKYADNVFRASAIATGLKLWECKTEEEKLARARLYRDWRTSKIYGKETKPCFEMAIKGEAVPVVEMFTDAPASPAEEADRAFRRNELLG